MPEGQEPSSHLLCKVPHTLNTLDRFPNLAIPWNPLGEGSLRICDAWQLPPDILI